MPKMQEYNSRAVVAALTLLGVNIENMTKLYIALDQAERQGFDDGCQSGKDEVFNDGYDSGYYDGHADGCEMFIDDNNVKENAQVEGFKFLNEDHMHDWELTKAVAALEDDCI